MIQDNLFNNGEIQYALPQNKQNNKRTVPTDIGAFRGMGVHTFNPPRGSVNNVSNPHFSCQLSGQPMYERFGISTVVSSARSVLYGDITNDSATTYNDMTQQPQPYNTQFYSPTAPIQTPYLNYFDQRQAHPHPFLNNQQDLASQPVREMPQFQKYATRQYSRQPFIGQCPPTPAQHTQLPDSLANYDNQCLPARVQNGQLLYPLANHEGRPLLNEDSSSQTVKSVTQNLQVQVGPATQEAGVQTLTISAEADSTGTNRIKKRKLSTIGFPNSWITAREGRLNLDLSILTGCDDNVELSLKISSEPYFLLNPCTHKRTRGKNIKITPELYILCPASSEPCSMGSGSSSSSTAKDGSYPTALDVIAQHTSQRNDTELSTSVTEPLNTLPVPAGSKASAVVNSSAPVIAVKNKNTLSSDKKDYKWPSNPTANISTVPPPENLPVNKDDRNTVIAAQSLLNLASVLAHDNNRSPKAEIAETNETDDSTSAGQLSLSKQNKMLIITTTGATESSPTPSAKEFDPETKVPARQEADQNRISKTSRSWTPARTGMAKLKEKVIAALEWRKQNKPCASHFNTCISYNRNIIGSAIRLINGEDPDTVYLSIISNETSDGRCRKIKAGNPNHDEIIQKSRATLEKKPIENALLLKALKTTITKYHNKAGINLSGMLSEKEIFDQAGDIIDQKWGTGSSDKG